MASRVDTAYKVVPRDSEDSYQESSPHEPLLSPSPVTMGTRTLFRQAWTFEFEFQPVYLIRFASAALAIATFVLFLIDGLSDFIAADIFAMLIVLLNASIILGRISKFREGLKLILPFELKFKGKAKPRFIILLDIGLSIGLLVSMLLGRLTRGNGWWERHNIKCLTGIDVGWAVFGVQVLIAISQLSNKRLSLTVKVASSEPKPNFDRSVLYRAPTVDPMRKSLDTRQSVDQPRQSTDDLV